MPRMVIEFRVGAKSPVFPLPRHTGSKFREEGPDLPSERFIQPRDWTVHRLERHAHLVRQRPMGRKTDHPRLDQEGTFCIGPQQDPVGLKASSRIKRVAERTASPDAELFDRLVDESSGGDGQHRVMAGCFGE